MKHCIKILYDYCKIVCFYNALLLESGRVFVLNPSHTKAQNMSQTIPRLLWGGDKILIFIVWENCIT